MIEIKPNKKTLVLSVNAKKVLKVYCFLLFILLAFTWYPNFGYTDEECSPLKEQPIKFEAWLSKQYRKDLGYLHDEFSAMGNTEVLLWEYPTENPSGVVAIGRCVPAFIARHAIKKALIYTKGVKSLVNQNFLYQHWMGIGANIFSELAQQRVSQEQVKNLLDKTLNTKEFQDLYQKYTKQDKLIFGFGMQLPNPKLMVEKGLDEE